MYPTHRHARRVFALLISLVACFWAPCEAKAAPDNVVTWMDGGTPNVSDAAQEWLREYGDTAHERWRQGGSKLYPPEEWKSNPSSAANKAAKADAKRFTGKLARVVSKGALRAVPFIGAGLTVYTICDYFSQGCFLFKRDEKADPGCLFNADNSMQICRTQQIHTLVIEGVEYGDFWMYTVNGSEAPGPVLVRACDSMAGFPGLPPLFTKDEVLNPNTYACDGAAVNPAYSGYYGDSAEFDGIASPADAAAADNSVQINVSNHFDNANRRELAEWLDAPEQTRIRQHIASEIDEDVKDPYIDGTRVPAPKTSETYEQYTARLKAAGLLGTLKFASSYHPAPAGTKPGRVFETSPEAGTTVEVGSTVVFRAVPLDGTGTDPGTGDDPATGPGSSPETPTHTQVGTPGPSGNYACPVAPASPNLTPLAINFSDKWPFGFVAWFGSVMTDLNSTGGAPNVELPTVGGHDWNLDLSPFNAEASVARTALGWAGSLFIVAWITQVALNRRITHETKD